MTTPRPVKIGTGVFRFSNAAKTPMRARFKSAKCVAAKGVCGTK